MKSGLPAAFVIGSALAVLSGCAPSSETVAVGPVGQEPNGGPEPIAIVGAEPDIPGQVTYLSEWNSEDRLISGALRDAIAHLQGLGGGKVIIEPRADQLSWLAVNVHVPSNIAIEGLPGAAIEMADPTPFAAIFVIDGAVNVTISGLELDGGFDHAANPSGNQVTWFAIRANRSINVTIRDNIIRRAEHGAVAFFATERSSIRSNTLTDSSRHVSGAHVWLFGSSDNEVNGNRITSDQGGVGVLIDDSSTQLSPNAGIASNNRVFDNDIQIRARGGQAVASATGVAIESGDSNRIYDNRIVAHWIGIQIQSGLNGMPIGDWGPTQSTYIADNEVHGESVGLVGIQAEKGADSTNVIGGLVDGFQIAGIRFLNVASADDPPVNGVPSLGRDVIAGTVLAANGRPLSGISALDTNVDVTIIE